VLQYGYMIDKKIIIGNWKMAPKSAKEARALFQNIRSTAGKMRNVQTVIAAPFVYLPELKKLVTGHRCVVGAQDVSFEKDEPHTGDVSADMLVSVGVEYVIVGHSEKRAKGETNVDVTKKAALATKKGMVAVVCVGEQERDEDGGYIHVIKEQLIESLNGVAKKDLSRVIVAYEPVWAIGSKAKREARSEDVLEMSIFIRKVLIDLFGEKKGAAIPLLYGGSVNQKNAHTYINGCEMQGLLIGRASLKPAVFETILKIANGK
jgi:triosephosphate isomerase